VKPEEIFAFLVPGNDPIQLLFGGLFLILIAATLIGVWRGATPASWEKKWNGSSQSDNSTDDLDVEHGSVNEISAAVASTGEKLADIMPGILLILGLLGTFLGLGIALNKASTILLEANAGGGMDNAMANLMGMMEGLGTKFKTSTWGITAFLLLKAWSAGNGYEERRLRWCVGKMKAAFEFSRRAQLEERQHTQHALIEALGRIDQTLVSQGQASQALLDTQCKLNKHASVTLVATHKAIQDLQQAMVPELRAMNASQVQTCDALLETVGNLQQHGVTLGQTHSAIQALQQALVPEVQTLNTSNAQARDALLEVVSNLQQHGVSLDAAHSAVQALQQALIPEVLALKASNEQVLDTLRDSAATLLQSNEGQQQQLKATQAAQNSLEQVAADISNLGAISEAATQMASAASDVGQSAGELQSVIGGFKDGVADVLGSIKHDLGTTIDQMGNSFTDNMASMSATMANATDGISTAVTNLSASVSETMNKMQKSNDDSMAIQKNAQIEFLATSENLNMNIGTMTGLVEDLRERIVSGLQAVSESGRRMVSVDSQFKDVTEKAARSAVAIEELVTELKQLQHASPLQPVMDAIAGRVEMIGHSLQRLDEHLLALKSAADDERQLNAIGQLQGPLERIVERLETLDTRLEQLSLNAEEA
jgi:exonuclease VII small subunit